MEYIFVYGSLKKNHQNNHYLKTSEFIGMFTTLHNNYNLINLGSFPACVSGDSYISGELYKINNNTLINLDRLEGQPFLYKRQLIKLKNTDIDAWIYIFQNNREFEYDSENITNVDNILSWSNITQ